MPARPSSPLYLLLLGMVLGGLAGFLGYSVLAGRESPLTAYPDRDPGDMVGGSEPAPPAAAAEDGAIRVTIALEPRARLDPAPAPDPVRIAGAGEDGDWQLEEARFLAGPAVLHPGATGRSLVRCRLRGGAVIERLVDRVVPGHVELRLLGPFTVRGRIRDANGQPLLNASVYLGGARTTTDETGAFEFASVLGGDAVPFAATAEDHAGRMRVFELNADAAAGPLDLFLEPGTTVRVQHAAAGGDGNGRAYVLPAAGEADTRLLQFPFFLQAVDGGAPVGDDGAALVTGLPRDVRMRAVVDHPLRPALAPVPFQVPPRATGEHQLTVTVAAREAPALFGRVVDETGAPLAGVLVASGPLAPPPRDAWCLPAIAYLLGGSLAETDASGSFAVGRVGGRRGGMLRWSAPGRHPLSLEVAALDGAVDLGTVMLPAAGELRGDPELRVKLQERGRRLRVRVLSGGTEVRGWTPWTDLEAYVVPLREAALVDVRVTVDGAPAFEAANLAVTGPRDVPVDR